MKNIFKIKIHFLFFLFAFLSVITGMFREFSIFTFIIIIHELGHILGGIIFKIYPKQVIILPFGGLTIFHMKVNTPLYKEFIIACLGPIIQLISWLFLSSYFHSIFFDKYNSFILLFNLLPIYPLDGSKIFNCLINRFMSFKKSFFLTVYLSIILICLLIWFIVFKSYSLGWLIILCFLIIKIMDEYRNFPFLFNKFLWERFNYNFHFRKEKLIKSEYLMKRDYKHLFKLDNYLVNEKEFLTKRFDFKDKM